MPSSWPGSRSLTTNVRVAVRRPPESSRYVASSHSSATVTATSRPPDHADPEPAGVEPPQLLDRLLVELQLLPLLLGHLPQERLHRVARREPRLVDGRGRCRRA